VSNTNVKNNHNRRGATLQAEFMDLDTRRSQLESEAGRLSSSSSSNTFADVGNLEAMVQRMINNDSERAVQQRAPTAAREVTKPITTTATPQREMTNSSSLRANSAARSDNRNDADVVSARATSKSTDVNRNVGEKSVNRIKANNDGNDGDDDDDDDDVDDKHADKKDIIVDDKAMLDASTLIVDNDSDAARVMRTLDDDLSALGIAEVRAVARRRGVAIRTLQTDARQASRCGCEIDTLVIRVHACMCAVETINSN
jgi:hypothetical protein